MCGKLATCENGSINREVSTRMRLSTVVYQISTGTWHHVIVDNTASVTREISSADACWQSWRSDHGCLLSLSHGYSDESGDSSAELTSVGPPGLLACPARPVYAEPTFRRPVIIRLMYWSTPPSSRRTARLNRSYIGLEESYCTGSPIRYTTHSVRSGQRRHQYCVSVSISVTIRLCQVYGQFNIERNNEIIRTRKTKVRTHLYKFSSHTCLCGRNGSCHI